MKSIHLGIRSAVATIFEGPVDSIRAEDLDGWFGIRPGRRDLVSVLPAGLLIFEDAEGEGFVALAGGLLELRGLSCRVMAREAVLARQLDDVSGRVEEHVRLRKQRAVVQRDVFDVLAKEALRRLAQPEHAR